MLRQIAARFGLRCESARRVRSAWQLNSGSERFYLKPTRAAGAELPLVIGLHDYLAMTAPGLAPEVLRDSAGEALLAAGGERFLLLTGLPGREAEYLEAKDYRAAAAGLRVFHRAACGYQPPIAWGLRRWYGTWPARLQARSADLTRFQTAARTPGSFGPAYAELWPFYQPQAEAARVHLRQPYYGQLSDRAQAAHDVCHHDLAHHNVLLDGPSVRFVDLDYTIADLGLHDLANLCNHLLRLHGWRAEPVYAAIRSYFGGAEPAGAELQLLGAMLLWPQDYWQIGRQYFDERQPWGEDAFLRLLARKCGPVEARRSFLAAFWRHFNLAGSIS